MQTQMLLYVLCHVKPPTKHAGYIFILLNINTAVQRIRQNVKCVSVMAEIPPLKDTQREDAF